MRNKIFILVCSVFIFAVFAVSPVIYVLSENGIVSVENVGNIIEKEKTYEDSFPASSLLNSVEEGKRVLNDIYINYVPGYVPLTGFVTGINNSLNSGVTDFLGSWGNDIMRDTLSSDKPSGTSPDGEPDSTAQDSETDAETEEPAIEYTYSTSLLTSDQNHRFYKVTAKGSDGEDKEFLCRVPSGDRRRLMNYSKNQINKINSLADARPDINFYVYVPTCLEDTALGTEILPSESTKDIFDNFISSMSENVNLGYMKIDTLEDKLDNYFLSDHHWNRYGSYEGYREIIGMMQENYADFGEAREIVEDCSFDATLYGSLALAVNSYNIGDPFGVLDFGLPEHNLRINTEVPYGGKQEFNTLLEKYKAGNFNKSKSYNHFMEFYRIAKTIEYPENDTGRNLLLIGDSFSTCVAELLASHFDKTYVRYVDSTTPERINYSDYIDKNGITDVLILETSTRIVLNVYRDSLNYIDVGGEG